VQKVDLVINCWEKNYRKVCNGKFIDRVINYNQYKFKNVFILVNNVKNKNSIIKKLDSLTIKKKIDEYFFVKDYIKRANEISGLTKDDYKRVENYINWALCIPIISRSEYVLHWDPDVDMIIEGNWISDSIKQMKNDSNIIAANPSWDREYGLRKHESFKEDKFFFYTHDFSDQVYLIRRVDFLKPIYKYWHIYSLRCPLAHIGSTYEKRVDGYMKRKNKIRITHKKAVYHHPDDSGHSYPAMSIVDIIKHYVFMVLITIYSFFVFKLLKKCTK